MNPQQIAEYALRAYSEKTYDIKGAQVLVVEDDDYVVIAFRGTEDADDVITDLRATPWYSREIGVWCHAGFLKSLRHLTRPLKGHIKHGKRVVLTGHSLGGAMAQIYAAYLVKRGFLPELTTFGAPRAGMAGLCKLSSQCEGQRYARDGDSVTEVPVYIPFLFPYEHDRNETPLKGADGVFDDHGMIGYLTEI